MKFSWIVSQIGARQHFGVPRRFFYKNELRLLYTEAWCRWGHSLLRKGPKPLRAFAGRYHPDLPGSKVVSFNTHTLWDMLRSGNRSRSVEAQSLEYLRIGRWFASAVADDLRRRSLNPGEDVFFGFNTGCLETLELMRERGVLTICDQIDPARVEEQLVFEESQKWPGWQKQTGRIPEEYWQRMSDEWAAASMVLVNSEWSKRALVKQGVPAEKMFIVPVAYEAEKKTHVPTRQNMNGPLTVLWIGSVILRKGIQYLIEAAKLLKDNPRVRIIVAGPVLISEQAVATAPSNMQFLGRLTRDQTEDWYRQADVFVLPTLSDGFAITQVEAMAQAMPVITTPNCGQVVTDGVDGLIVPAYDGPALARAIETLDQDRARLREMSYRALDKIAQFRLAPLAQLVENAVVNNYRKGLPL
jgi:glycosyltransferase involved in cell wall biosynthesis